MKKLLVILLTFIVFISLIGCKKSNDTNQQDNNSSSENIIIKDSTPFTNNYGGGLETFEIPTPYVTLYYPVEWKNLIKTNVVETDIYYGVTFVALLDGIELPVFEIGFGESKTAYPLGKIPTDNDQITIYCEDYTEGSTEYLSSESVDIYLQMSEDINVIISRLIESGAIIS